MLVYYWDIFDLKYQCYYLEYESNFGIDHSRIVDLLKVFDISSTIDAATRTTRDRKVGTDT